MSKGYAVTPRSAMGARAVFLVGFMASGKSAVGRELARRLGWEFVDLDTHIEVREGQTISEIFAVRREHGFREAETSALRELLTTLRADTVVATGGGTFAQPKNRELLKPWPSVFLEASLDELWRRCLSDPTKRPLRQEDPKSFSDMYCYRLPFYREATATVDTTSKEIATICAEIEAVLHLNALNTDGTSSPKTGGS